MRRRVRVIRDIRGVDAVREAEDGLHVRAACAPRERGPRPRVAVLGPVAVAPPRDGCDFLVCRSTL
jgi:hypothetical protein